MTGLRILITGSRGWTDSHVIGDALAEAVGRYGSHLVVADERLGPLMSWDQVTVVHGDARGADRHAARIARAWGMVVEPHPADWVTHGRAAGHIRNAEMVALGADVMLAFPLGESRGTRGCMALAEKAGIPVLTFAPSGEAVS